MKFFLAIVLACTYASAHPGAERVKRQSASSGSASSYASGSNNGGTGFAFSGGSGLPFGDLFSSFPGFDQGSSSNNGSNAGATNSSSKRDTTDNALATDLHPPSADASAPNNAYGSPFHFRPMPFVPSPGLLTVFAQTIQMLGQLIVGIIHTAASNVSNAAYTFPTSLNNQLSTIGSSGPVGVVPKLSTTYGAASSDNIERNFNQSDVPITGLSPPDSSAVAPVGTFGSAPDGAGFVPGPAPPGTSGFIPAGSSPNMTFATALNNTLGRLSAGLDALLNAVDTRRLFSRGGFNNYNAYSANMFPQSRPFAYGDYNGVGSYNNGYYTGGNYGAGFNSGTNGLGGFSSGYNTGNNGYYNNYPAYPRYAPSYDQTSSSSFANSPPADVGLFSRISPVAPIYAGPGVSSSFSSSSSNGNGGGITFTESNVDGVRSGSTTHVDPSGRVTSYQHGTGTQDVLSTRMLQPGQSSGIYSASGVTNNNGNVSAFRAGGAIN